jgi:hypothetical protein
VTLCDDLGTAAHAPLRALQDRARLIQFKQDLRKQEREWKARFHPQRVGGGLGRMVIRHIEFSDAGRAPAATHAGTWLYATLHMIYNDVVRLVDEEVDAKILSAQ